MDAVVGDSLESYLSRYRLRLLVDEWLGVVAQRQPEDPFSCLVELINEYNRDGCGFVTCENKWCEMMIPASEYAAHLETCSEVGKWVKCMRCNVRVEASRMRQHKQNCKLESCVYCGEMVVPRLRDMCPFKLKVDAERACRKQASAEVMRDNLAFLGSNATLSLRSFLMPSFAGAPPYLKRPLSLSPHLKDRLICIQNSWRNAFLRNRFQDVLFKSFWHAVELYRERQVTQEHIAIPRDHPKASSPCLTNYTAFMGGCVHVSMFEALAKTITSGGVVEFEMAKQIISMTTSILAERPLVQRVTIPEGGDVVVIGDLHGQMKDLCEAIVLAGGLPNPQRYLVFNGDFVDRGSNGMGVLLYIFTLLCTFPSFVFINRGNHEDARVNAEYGFEVEIYGKYGIEHAEQLLEALADSYQSMPLMTVLDGMILIAHGGLPRAPVTLDRIESLGRMRDIPTSGSIGEDEQIMMDILWNDPVEKFHSRQLGMRHRAQHWRTSKRGCGVEYLAPITEEFLRLNNLRLVVRSHEEVQAGFELVHNGKCCTVFSASNYCGVSSNRAALAVFPKGSLHPVFHTWYVRSDESEDLATKELLDEIMTCEGGKRDNNKDDEETGGGGEAEDVNKAEANDNAVAGGDEVAHMIGDVAGRDKEDTGADSSTTYSSSVEGALVPRLNLFMQLGEIIFRKRYSLLSGFVAADYNQTGIIYKIEWCEVMRSVLEIDIPWYYLCKFVAPQGEPSEVPCVRYVSFLRRFDVRFSSQYLLPFQVAIVRRVFGDMDLPDDLLSRLDSADVLEVTAASLPAHGQCQPLGVAGNKSGPISSEARHGFSRTKSSTRKSQESDAAQSLSCMSASKPWRFLKVDFNVFVSILRSLSHVAATLEDDVAYALFQYLDQEECGHVVLGSLVDLVEATLVEEEEIVMLGTGSTRDADAGLTLRDDEDNEPPEKTETAVTSSASSAKASFREGHGERKQDANPAASTTATAGKEQHAEPKMGASLFLSSQVLPCTSDNTDAAVINFCRTLDHVSHQQSRSSMEEDITDALWLYPALLRLHEGFNYGLLTSLQQSFRNLNSTNDGKLTFDQLNVAVQLIGRHMREPLTETQAKRIFSTIRSGGKRLTMTHSRDIFSGTRYEPHNLSLLIATSDELTTVPDSEDASDVLHITMKEFVTFFSVTFMGGNWKREGSGDMGSFKATWIADTWSCLSFTGCRRSDLDTFLEDLRAWPYAEVLDGLTVESFSSRFDGSKTLLRALQELLCASAAQTRAMEGTAVNCTPSSRSVERGIGLTCPLATNQLQLLALNKSKLAQSSMLKSVPSTSATTEGAPETVSAVTPEAREEVCGHDGTKLPKTAVGVVTHTDAAPTMAPALALASTSSSLPASVPFVHAEAYCGAGVRTPWRRQTDKVHTDPLSFSSKLLKTSAPAWGTANDDAQSRRVLAKYPVLQGHLLSLPHSFPQTGEPKMTSATLPSRKGGESPAQSKLGSPSRLPTLRGALERPSLSAQLETTDASPKRK
ncbi:serine/threonine protein phosphatase-like protein [Trypanosoma rangeli]|uniref:Serine/threonine-protein phosphatase n=1 Tax=Trypanosoma rangeli TaxID=5698 RepID=A0A422N3U2_TRYRA|nr:serine/threonine protein phosphatase-like protein [Trypanosoma rangeli]RNF00126.1 serine/threonine protein phosphatase-like protein [Trypanosoma rangeli]|eukprot:RNF00126.1 serine/threonine protein phosphatase-like protein [Trypanosoma rangeli]